MEKRLIHKTNVCHWVGLFSLHHNLFYNYIFQEYDHVYDILLYLHNSNLLNTLCTKTKLCWQGRYGLFLIKRWWYDTKHKLNITTRQICWELTPNYVGRGSNPTKPHLESWLNGREILVTHHTCESGSCNESLFFSSKKKRKVKICP